MRDFIKFIIVFLLILCSLNYMEENSCFEHLAKSIKPIFFWVSGTILSLLIGVADFEEKDNNF